jgi:hypothetical protein
MRVDGRRRHLAFEPFHDPYSFVALVAFTSTTSLARAQMRCRDAKSQAIISQAAFDGRYSPEIAR